MKKKILNSDFLRRVITLAGGTAIAQVIAILSLPILTRLYGPEAFSQLAVYVSVITIVASIACLCFEYAIPLPKSERMAASLCVLSIAITLLITVVVSAIVFVFPSAINNITGNKINDYLWLLPLGVFFVGLYNALQYWSSRNKKFKLIAETRVAQSLGGTGIKLGFGYFGGAATIGLIFGQMLAQGAGFLRLGFALVKEDRKLFSKIKLRYLYLSFHRYKQFPKFTTLEVLSNNGGIQVPIILIAAYTVGGEAGQLMVAMQLLSIPMGLIGGAVSQVYLAEGADRYHNGDLNDFTKNTIKSLAKIAIVPLAGAALISPFMMPLLLGEEWHRTGMLVSWMVPWFFVQFITSPVSTALYITNNQKIAFMLQLFGLIIRAGAVLFVALYFNYFIAETYALSGLVFYFIYLAVILRILKEPLSEKKSV